MKLLALLLLAVPLVANARCNNACSGHGTCGQYDSCLCHTNWRGSDCSQRVCMYNTAWVTSSNGDLNFDGDEFDATPYHYDYKYTSSSGYVATDARPGGDFEQWPATASTTTDEGHFYMECSNRGLCDRKTGICKCFDGYEGGACSRRNCHNDCSGHGRCLTVAQLTSEYNTANSASLSYNLWDKDMARTCACDAGYTGIDCSERYCPRGDDPLTTKYQINEVQYIDVYSSLAQASVTTELGGRATFSYKDPFGETWTTDPITIQHYDGTTSADQMATDLEAALEAIPNNAITDVTVTAGYCEKVLPSKFQNYDANTATSDKYNSGTNPASGYLRCPGSTATYDQTYLVVAASDANVVINGFAGSADPNEGTATGTTAATGTNDVTCRLIAYPECVRFRVEFTKEPGDHNEITVDVSAVTINGKTNAQDSAMLIASSSTDRFDLVDDSTASIGYVRASTAIVQSTDTNGVITPAAKTVSFGTASSSAFTFPIGAKVDLYCIANSVQAYLGRYTMASTVSGGGTLTFTEKIIAPNGDCASTGSTTKVQLVTEFVTTNTDFTSVGNLVGSAVNFDTFVSASQYVDATVDSVSYDQTSSTGFIFFEGNVALTSDHTAATGVKLQLWGTGSKENNECSDRGLCDSETGICKCYAGYTGDACSFQNQLAV